MMQMPGHEDVQAEEIKLLVYPTAQAPPRGIGHCYSMQWDPTQEFLAVTTDRGRFQLWCALPPAMSQDGQKASC